MRSIQSFRCSGTAAGPSDTWPRQTGFITRTAGLTVLLVAALAAQAPLTITGPNGALFSGTVGVAYTATTFTAAGGTSPYTWSIVSGNADGLTMSAAGVLSGTPLASGTFTFAVQVADSANGKVSQSFSLVVNSPALIITAASFPNGAVGVLYNQTTPAAIASGGAPPYTWSLASGSIPGLTFVPANVAFTGTPTTAGTFPITLQVADSGGLTASKQFSVTIAAATLNITTARQLPAAVLSSAYSEQLAATGGTPPYTWLANGLPAGLAINSTTGLISGTPTAAGSFPIIVITVVDSALKSYQDNFSLAVNLPSAPAITVSGLPAAPNPASQYPIQVTLASAFPATMIGQLIIGFQANTGLGDSTVQFSTGGTTANFTIAAGSTSAIFTGANGIAVQQLQMQTGTVAGAISLSLSNLTAGGVDITPVPTLSLKGQVASAAPVITSVSVSSNGTGGCPSGQICIQVTGYATSRTITSSTYTFNAVSGQTLQPSAGSITVDVTALFASWFGTSTVGSQFILNQPFTVTGSPSAVIPVSVSLTGPQGTTNASIPQQ